MDDNKKQGWYCSHCAMGVPSSEVTFDETHTVCGRVITDDMHVHVGMSLRDYFAAQALPEIARMNYTSSNKQIAEWSYNLADEMLRAREAK